MGGDLGGMAGRSPQMWEVVLSYTRAKVGHELSKKVSPRNLKSRGLSGEERAIDVSYITFYTE